MVAPTKTAEPPVLPKEIVILSTNIGHDLFVSDVQTGIQRLLFQARYPATFIKWHQNGCRFYLRDGEGNIRIANLDGEIVRNVITHSALENRNLDPYGLRVFLSPDNQWIWYWTASGRPYDEVGPARMEVQDIQVISIDLKKGPYPISTHGGGWVADWSPNGQRIAFSDYDDRHVLQVFTASVLGEDRVPLTHFDQPSTFEQPGSNVSQVIWSPEGKRLAVNYSFMDHDREVRAALVVDENGNEIYRQEDGVLWWIDDQSIVSIKNHNPSAHGVDLFRSISAMAA